MSILAACVLALLTPIAILLTAMTLPGLWLPVIVASVWTWFDPGLMSPWMIAGAVAIGVGAELVEFFGAAHGTRKSGGTRVGAIGATVGTILGAIVGSFVVPILGTIVGAVVGAGVGALGGERGIGARTWRESWRSGRGAARGRVVSMVIKSTAAGVMGLMLAIAPLVS